MGRSKSRRDRKSLQGGKGGKTESSAGHISSSRCNCRVGERGIIGRPSKSSLMEGETSRFYYCFGSRHTYLPGNERKKERQEKQKAVSSGGLDLRKKQKREQLD